MLGSEYNWLITLTRPTNGTPRARIASDALFTLAIAVLCFLSAALHVA